MKTDKINGSETSQGKPMPKRGDGKGGKSQRGYSSIVARIVGM